MKYQCIICTAEEKEHYDIYEVIPDGKMVEGNGTADKHGAWETGFGDTPEKALLSAKSFFSV